MWVAEKTENITKTDAWEAEVNSREGKRASSSITEEKVWSNERVKQKNKCETSR